MLQGAVNLKYKTSFLASICYQFNKNVKCRIRHGSKCSNFCKHFNIISLYYVSTFRLNTIHHSNLKFTLQKKYFRQGCALCFCSGVSQQCQSSNLRRKTHSTRFSSRHIADQVEIYTSAPSFPGNGVKYNAPIRTELRPRLLTGELGLTEFDRSQDNIYYWSLPLR